MNCSVCHRPHSAKKLPFLCAVDARNRLYEGRLEFAGALIRNEEIERQVNASLSCQEKGEELASRQNPAARAEPFAPRVRMDWLKSEEADTTHRTSRIIAQADRLKAEIDAARKEVGKKKDAIARRKSDLATVSVGSSARRSRQLDEAERSIQRLRYKWNRSADTMAATRSFLCEEAARLYGLRQIKKGSTRRYEIGGVEIAELHAMDGVSPEIISTSLAHIAHILVLASHYLAIRLPAEITLPHRDYPRPTVFSLASSYRHEKIAFPGSTQLPSGTGDGERQYSPRPRPLFIDKPLATLAKEDPQAYSLFLEGVSLLAYNIAWACCSQGVSCGDKDSYEDICNMGQNLWRLLIGDQIHRRSVEPMFLVSLAPSPAVGAGSPKKDEEQYSNNNNNNNDGELTNPKSMLGRWSHGTMHTFLGGAQGSEFIRNFKILVPAKIVDRLKKRLTSEAPILEWEKIEENEIEDDYDNNHTTADRAGGTAAASDLLGVESIMTVRTTASTSTKDGNTSGGRSDGNSASTAGARGTSGWTKLKSRYDK
ncbi:UV radiation resistance protein and autophagy-related subunit 14-domain-containing protein [Apodospora peruviana]|uniref:Autophagy-related protein 14 n=1 Tax=Apodospora peruviana TaxID=516989 RepID=A0AAE0MFU8_9PEZI|nr:UV radiation resistance protein and autophagy-related subunit 14-domain-containing protein [Apodospora peruviana]